MNSCPNDGHPAFYQSSGVTVWEIYSLTHFTHFSTTLEEIKCHSQTGLHEHETTHSNQMTSSQSSVQ